MYHTINYQSIEKEIQSCIRCGVGSQQNSSVFEKLCEVFQAYYDRPCTNMLELKKRTAKSKGTAFEVFCVMYLRQKGYDDVWMLSELPGDIRELLGLGKQDVGIDLIARTKKRNGDGHLYFPVQCKYRKQTFDYTTKRMTHKVGWKDISTFLSLCTRTGCLSSNGESRSWTKHIIMTNAQSVCWKGHKTKKDYTIAKQTFEKSTNMFWVNFLSSEAKPMSLCSEAKPITFLKSEAKPMPLCSEAKPLTNTNIRSLRQAWLDRLSNRGSNASSSPDNRVDHQLSSVG